MNSHEPGKLRWQHDFMNNQLSMILFTMDEKFDQS